MWCGGEENIRRALGVVDVFVAEPLVELDSINRIHRTHKVALVAERNGGVDTHAAFETGIRCRPLFFAGGHAFGRHEGLAATAR